VKLKTGNGIRFNAVSLAFMATAFMLGVAGALQMPTLSLFLTREVKALPFQVGLFYTVNAIAGIVVSMTSGPIPSPGRTAI